MEQVAIEDRATARQVRSAVAFEIDDVVRQWRVTARWIYSPSSSSANWVEGSWMLTEPENVLVQFTDGQYGVVSEDNLPAALASTGQTRA